MKVRSRSRFTIIEFPVFSNYFIHVEITSDLEKSLKKYPSCQPALDSGMANSEALTVHVCDLNHTFVFLRPKASPGTIAHESWHAIKHMMEEVGVEIDHETAAYHLGYLVNRIHNFKRQCCKVPKPHRVSKQNSKRGRE